MDQLSLAVWKHINLITYLHLVIQTFITFRFRIFRWLQGLEVLKVWNLRFWGCKILDLGFGFLRNWLLAFCCCCADGDAATGATFCGLQLVINGNSNSVGREKDFVWFCMILYFLFTELIQLILKMISKHASKISRIEWTQIGLKIFKRDSKEVH